MRIGVVTFPGSNCDYDAYAAFRHVVSCPVEFLWHADPDLHNVDCVVLPGGFSFGDYLRAGAIARFSPVMQSVIKFASDGGLVWGICNGFQVLTEAGLLPGTLRRNAHMRFACRQVHLRVENNRTPFTRGCRPGQILMMPIAHGEGNYYAAPEVLDELEHNGQVVFRYVNAQGEPDVRSNPNGSRHNIAGITNGQGNVLGMMPHPERAVESILGSADGLALFQSLIGVGVQAVGTEAPSASPLIEKRRARV